MIFVLALCVVERDVKNLGLIMLTILHEHWVLLEKRTSQGRIELGLKSSPCLKKQTQRCPTKLPFYLGKKVFQYKDETRFVCHMTSQY